MPESVKQKAPAIPGEGFLITENWLLNTVYWLLNHCNIGTRSNWLLNISA
jgi:hypothetical protein